jgi:DNA-binding protein HU-beta
MIEKMADDMGVTKGVAAKGLDSLIGAVTDALADGDKVYMGGLGTFRLQRFKATVGRNPKTGEEIQIPSRKRIKFRPNEVLAARVAAL